MKKKILILLGMTVLLSGCYNKYSSEILMYAMSKCENNGGTNYIFFPNSEQVLYSICNNGAEFRIDRGEYE